MSAEDKRPKPTRARTLDDCAEWPTIFAITCTECGGELGDARGPRCTDCRMGMGADITAALQTVIANASSCDPGSITRRVGPTMHGDYNDTPGLTGKYVAIDPHTRRSI